MSITPIKPASSLYKDLEAIRAKLDVSKRDICRLGGFNDGIYRAIEVGTAVFPSTIKKIEAFKKAFAKGEFVPLETKIRREAALVIERGFAPGPPRLLALVEELDRQKIFDLSVKQFSQAVIAAYNRAVRDVFGTAKEEAGRALTIMRKFRSGEMGADDIEHVKHASSCKNAFQVWTKRKNLASAETPLSSAPAEVLEKRQTASIERLLSAGSDPRKDPVNKLANVAGVMACFLDVLLDQANATNDADLTSLVGMARDHNTELSARTRQLLLKRNSRNGRMD